MRLSRVLCAATVAVAVAVAVAACGRHGGTPGVDRPLRFGHFPNITHAHGLVAHHASRSGKGWFEERVGAPVEWYTFNAGPSAMEALLAGSVDVTYVGPNPAINAHVRSNGDEVRVVAGATRGGAALVVRPGSGIESPKGFRGKRVATPQFGNTQDVAARAWLKAQGFAVTQTGGDVSVIPTENPDQLALFKSGELDAVWTVEPWVSRLEDAGGRVFVDEKDAVTTVLVMSARFLREQPAMAKKLGAAHEELTTWMNDHAAEARASARDELAEETRAEISDALVAKSWARMRFATAIGTGDFEDFLRAAQDAGFLTEVRDLSRLVETPR